MTLDGFDTLIYTLAFVVPGFVMNYFYSYFSPQKRDDTQAAILKFMFFSCLHYVIWSWAFYIMLKTNYQQIHPLRTTFFCAAIILISPMFFGTLGGVLSQNNSIRKLLNRIGLFPIHPVPTAWDYKFSKVRNRRWVLITLKDGSTVRGLFGENSFASSDPDERDLYIEKVYIIKDDGLWDECPRSQGVLIKGDQIKHIEFMV